MSLDMSGGQRRVVEQRAAARRVQSDSQLTTRSRRRKPRPRATPLRHNLVLSPVNVSRPEWDVSRLAQGSACIAILESRRGNLF